jgi:DNA-binding NarL/FixJ family response regulator
MVSGDPTPAASDTSEPLRAVVAEDDALLREGIASLPQEAGHRVVGRAANAGDLQLKVRSHVPDVAIVDVRMPPDADAGLRAAAELRLRHPTVSVLVPSQHLEPAYMLELVGNNASGVGYLLKDRVRGVAEFSDAVERVAGGGTAFDPAVVSSLVSGRRRSVLDELSDRERTVLSLIAEGRSNRAIAKQLYLSPRAVERHVQAIFQTLGLAAPRTTNAACSPCSHCSDAEHLADSRHAPVGRPPQNRRQLPSRGVARAAKLLACPSISTR